MPFFKLYARFEVRDSAEDFIDTYADAGEFASLEDAENALENKISEMVSGFSSRSLNWVLLEKCVTAEQEIDDIINPENLDTGKSKSGQDFSLLML